MLTFLILIKKKKSLSEDPDLMSGTVVRQGHLTSPRDSVLCLIGIQIALFSSDTGNRLILR